MTDHEPDAIVTGDAFDVLPDLPDESVHACVTDPPYGLAFMGRDWDDFEPKEYQEWCEEWATLAKRVLKPGGHLLAFSGNRTHHRLFTGVADAGFEVRDTVTWHYGNGFPKALDVSKALGGDSRWEGWKTVLKPATEFVGLARKPLSEGTVAENVLEHSTGALNVDGCQIESGVRKKIEHTGDYDGIGGLVNQHREEDTSTMSDRTRAAGTTTEGRYPANVVFGEQAAADLDEQEGTRQAGDPKDERGSGGIWSESEDGIPCGPEYGDEGGPSRYFYTSKASKSERTLDGWIENAHPTVKPQDLMEWLVKLVTREEQVVLDPFTGSGTTCRAAKELNRQFIGIERQEKWADVARVRCNLTPEDPTVVRENDNQTGWEAW